MTFKDKYGIPASAVLTIRRPPEEMMRTMGMKPEIKFPMFGDHTTVDAFRQWCANNFKHDYRVYHWPFPQGNASRGAGFDIEVSGDEEDLMLLAFAA